MSARRHQLLDQALDLSRRMASLAEAGEWSEVIALESRRSALLDEALRDAAAADEHTARLIHAILASDKTLLGASVTARDAAAAELSQMQRGRKVRNAYQSAAR